METITAIVFGLVLNGITVETFGPHQEVDDRIKIPVFSEKTGEVLYYDYAVE